MFEFKEVAWIYVLVYTGVSAVALRGGTEATGVPEGHVRF